MMVQSFRQIEKSHAVTMLERCKKDYLKLVQKNPTLKRLIENILEELKLRPYIGEKLSANFPGCRSIHFSGNNYRIIYRILGEPDREILILEIGHRSSSYTDLARRLGQGK